MAWDWLSKFVGLEEFARKQKQNKTKQKKKKNQKKKKKTKQKQQQKKKKKKENDLKFTSGQFSRQNGQIGQSQKIFTGHGYTRHCNSSHFITFRIE